MQFRQKCRELHENPGHLPPSRGGGKSRSWQARELKGLGSTQIQVAVLVEEGEHAVAGAIFLILELNEPY